MNKAAGFITLHRQIMDWEWYSDASTFCLFIHLLLGANYVDGRFKGRVIKRGQLVTSLRSLATHCGLSLQQTRTALEHLVSTHEVTHEANQQYSVITIVKYDEYQMSTQQATHDQHTINTQSNTRSTHDLTHDQHRYNNNNNINKGTNKQRNNNPPTSPQGEEPPPDDFFFTFWQMYPKKVAKKDAEKAWKKLNPDEVLAAQIFDGLEKWIGSESWQRDGGRFIPYPASWLNGRRWEDDIPEAVKAPGAGMHPTKTVTAQQYSQRDYSEYTLDSQIAAMLALEGT